MNDHDVRIVVLGGGTGTSTLLEELKHHTKELTAIVAMSDDGGSNAKIRDQYRILPLSDARQCVRGLVDTETAKELFDYRFTEGDLRGHTAGNIVLAALYKSKGSFKAAIAATKELFTMHGNILPVTTDDVRLHMSWDTDESTIISEHAIDTAIFTQDPRTARLTLVPEARLDADAKGAIMNADIIVIAPGNLYCSTGALLATPSIGAVLKHTTAKVVYICNLVQKQGHTDGFTVSDYANELERIAGEKFLDAVICNNPVDELDVQLAIDEALNPQYAIIPSNIRSMDASIADDGTDVVRSTARHNAQKVVEEIYSFYTANS